MTIDVVFDWQTRVIPDQTRDKRDPQSIFMQLMKEDRRIAIRDRDPIDRPLSED